MPKEYKIGAEGEERLAKLGEEYLMELHQNFRNPSLESYLAKCQGADEKDLFVEMAKTIVGVAADIHVIERRKQSLPPTLNPAVILRQAMKLENINLAIAN